MKIGILAAALAAFAVAPSLAQESSDATTTGVASVNASTTGTMASSDAATTAASAGRRVRVQGMDFEKRWERTEQSYKKAGIPDEKIQQLKALDKRVFESLQNGEKIDFAAIREERNKVLGEEEQEKIRKAREEMATRLRRDSGTTATAPAAPTNQQ